MSMEAWLGASLVCPRDRQWLTAQHARLACAAGCVFDVSEGVPVLLLDEVEPTQEGYWATREEQYRDVRPGADDAGEVDLYVRTILRGTCGNLYARAEGDYPIPELRLPPGEGRLFLELGSNWGRWCVAAGRKGYRPVGVDPALGAILAARRVARQLGAEAAYLVADARYLPFADETFDVVFSYSVLQHLSPADVRACIDETTRVLKPGGVSLHQLPGALGLRNLYRLARRGFRRALGFEVRLWSPRALLREFGRIGPTTLEADGFFSLNAQPGDLALLPLRHRVVVRASEAGRKASELVPPLRLLADSLYIRSVRQS